MGLNTTDIIVLAGGLGTRLKDALPDTPKILAPIGGGRTYLDFLLGWLEKQGARRIIFALGHRSGAVMDYLTSQPRKADYIFSIEPAPLGTAGALRLAAGHVKSKNALILNGDSWTDCDLNAFIADFEKNPPNFSLLCTEVENASRYGTVTRDATGTITGFREKNAGQKTAGLVSAGIYLFGQKALQELAKSTGPSLEKDFFEKRIDLAPRAYAVKAAFIDIGTPESLAAAANVFTF